MSPERVDPFVSFCIQGESTRNMLPVPKFPADLRKADVHGSLGHMAKRNAELARVLAVGNRQNSLGQTEQ